jgi:hypothetical protein
MVLYPLQLVQEGTRMIILKDCTSSHLVHVERANIRLDHWLSANASMAVGSLTGPQIDTNAFQPLPNPSFDPNIMMNPAPALSPFPQTQQWDMGMTPGAQMQMDWSQPVQFGGEVVLPTGLEGGQENSDEYWNALIDGES